jgi:hypothetical protein
MIHPPDLSGKYQQRHPVAKQDKLGEKWPLNFAYELPFFDTRRIL